MRKKSTRQHQLDGTFRPGRHSTNEPQIGSPESLREPPGYLSDTAAAIWRDRIGPLLDSRIITVADAPMFADLCQLEADYRSITAELQEFGFIVDSAREDGARVKNPAWQIAREMLQHINSMRRDFGMSPVSRSKVEALPEPKADNKWARFDKDKEFRKVAG
jgi:P27 family predicted phage terminase small subunit